MSCVRRANDVVVTIVDPSAGQTFAKELKSVNEIVPTADIPRLLSHMSLLYRRYDVILDLTSVYSSGYYRVSLRGALPMPFPRTPGTRSSRT